jgi:FtsP/CotA-like multicopper oxidase with cupredoxin domain
MISYSGCNCTLLQVDVFCPETPYNVFRVRQGKKYRFRLVGGTCTSCAYRFSIEQHALLIIAVDGSPIEPVRVNSIDMYGGILRKYYILHTEKLVFSKKKENLKNTLSA